MLWCCCWWHQWWQHPSLKILNQLSHIWKNIKLTPQLSKMQTRRTIMLKPVVVPADGLARKSSVQKSSKCNKGQTTENIEIPCLKLSSRYLALKKGCRVAWYIFGHGAVREVFLRYCFLCPVSPHQGCFMLQQRENVVICIVSGFSKEV